LSQEDTFSSREDAPLALIEELDTLVKEAV
jgi:hypothetical protein